MTQQYFVFVLILAANLSIKISECGIVKQKSTNVNFSKQIIIINDEQSTAITFQNRTDSNCIVNIYSNGTCSDNTHCTDVGSNCTVANGNAIFFKGAQYSLKGYFTGNDIESKTSTIAHGVSPVFNIRVNEFIKEWKLNVMLKPRKLTLAVDSRKLSGIRLRPYHVEYTQFSNEWCKVYLKNISSMLDMRLELNDTKKGDNGIELTFNIRGHNRRISILIRFNITECPQLNESKYRTIQYENLSYASEAKYACIDNSKPSISDDGNNSLRKCLEDATWSGSDWDCYKGPEVLFNLSKWHDVNSTITPSEVCHAINDYPSNSTMEFSIMEGEVVQKDHLRVQLEHNNKSVRCYWYNIAGNDSKQVVINVKFPLILTGAELCVKTTAEQNFSLTFVSNPKISTNVLYFEITESNGSRRFVNAVTTELSGFKYQVPKMEASSVFKIPHNASVQLKSYEDTLFFRNIVVNRNCSETYYVTKPATETADYTVGNAQPVSETTHSTDMNRGQNRGLSVQVIIAISCCSGVLLLLVFIVLILLLHRKGGKDSSVQNEVQMDTANPLYETTGDFSKVAQSEEVANPLYGPVNPAAANEVYTEVRKPKKGASLSLEANAVPEKKNIQNGDIYAAIAKARKKPKGKDNCAYVSNVQSDVADDAGTSSQQPTTSAAVTYAAIDITARKKRKKTQ